MSEAFDLSNLKGVDPAERQKIADAAANEGARRVITAFVVTLEEDGTWLINTDFGEPIVVTRQVAGDDLVAAAAVMTKDVYAREGAVHTQMAMMQAAQQQMQAMQEAQLRSKLGV